MKKYTNRGFTLIELLVVIAIIGILSSIVLASLSTARSKGKDSAVQEQLQGARAQAEIYANGSSYSGVCAALASANPPGLAGILAGVATANSTTVQTSGAGDATHTTCHDASGTWVADSYLPGQLKWFCVDNTGAAKVEAAGMLAAATACL